jgi:hypothetical protein
VRNNGKENYLVHRKTSTGSYLYMDSSEIKILWCMNIKNIIKEYYKELDVKI